MPFPNLPWRLIGMIAGLIALVAISALTVRSCDKRHARAAQSRVERSQAQAASNSAADAIGTVARSGEASAASEDLTRSNGEQIRAADGANQKVGAGVDAAGRAALCRRQAYANDPKCKKP
jgi:ABC-type protease/lipase transport system fused ATPase/permease subunit